MSHAFWILAKYRALIFGRLAVRAGWARTVVVLAYLILSLSIALGVFYFFSQAFARLLSEPYSGPVIISYAVELSLAIAMVLGVISFVISSTSVLFRNRDTENRFALPVSPQTIFWQRFIGLTLLSAWPILLVAVPALAALGVVLSAPLVYYLSMIPVLLLFSVLISVTGGIVSFLIAALLQRMPLILTYGAEAVLFLVVAVAGTRRVINSEVFTLLSAITPQAAEAAEVRLDELFGSLPSHPFAKVFLSVFAEQLSGDPVAGLGLTALVVSVLILVLAFLARRYYRPLWQSYGEGDFVARREDVVETAPRTLSAFPRFFKWGHGYLFEKDLLMLFRSPSELSRALFMLLLLLLYLLAVQIVSSLDFISTAADLTALLTFVFIAIAYFTVTVGLRFAFPSFSLEGQGAWMLWVSPLHHHEILFWKYTFWTALTLIAMEAVAGLAIYLFGVPFLLGTFLVFVTAATVLSLTAITLCIGAIWPDFKMKNPDSLSTSPPGLLALALSLLFVWVMARYTHSFIDGYLSAGSLDLTSLAAILVLTTAVVMFFMIVSRQAIERLEVGR
jgi:ABC-2 type transport system permease protein